MARGKFDPFRQGPRPPDFFGIREVVCSKPRDRTEDINEPGIRTDPHSIAKGPAMPTSEARIRANRANSLKSKGPTSPRGKGTIPPEWTQARPDRPGASSCPRGTPTRSSRRAEALQADLGPEVAARRRSWSARWPRSRSAWSGRAGRSPPPLADAGPPRRRRLRRGPDRRGRAALRRPRRRPPGQPPQAPQVARGGRPADRRPGASCAPT